MSRFFASGGQSIRSHQVSTPGGLGSGSYFSLYPRVPDMNWMHLDAFKIKERQGSACLFPCQRAQPAPRLPWLLFGRLLLGKGLPWWLRW